MDFRTIFQKPDAAAVEVKHDGGVTFYLYPRDHSSAQAVLQRKAKIDVLRRAMNFYNDKEGEFMDRVARHYATMDEYSRFMNSFYAAHIAGWSDLEQDGAPLPHSYETALGLLEFDAFRNWIEEKINALADDKAEAAQLDEDIKKKSSEE
ncbi:hypothetical protein [Phenylobacterium sp. SCN 70-31]|uniref:hypothetical protein n=1 Tax=Phenylobacterium sp. SCN 70-31 TaxID=1660129 RepID=UPI00086A7EB2|nr:hypothetical protein [Phenylobacterium sp. SCN 70-31]ODT85636.1 MAG: hypothetical protein ABS78_19425 [Phenylobacterium sp. SCN 70-31]